MEKIEITKETVTKSINCLVENIKRYPNTTTIITNSKMGAVLQDYHAFMNDISYNNLNIYPTFQPYVIGSIDNISIYVNPFMKWNEDILILLNRDERLQELVVTDAHNII